MFITGLFSMLDVMLDKPMAEVLDELPLVSPVRLALLDCSGKHGAILKKVIMYERGLWNDLVEEQADTDLFIKFYPKAISWAYSTSSSLVEK
jgi:EAL and modified HD-GYP domain-containing signal transduction protein